MLPIEMPGFEHDGHVSLSFGGDWYYRIHVIPASIVFPNISSDVEDTYLIWNAWFEAKSLTYVTDDTGGNVVLTDENAVEYSSLDMLNLGYLGSMTMTATATEEGDHSFDITHTWTVGDEVQTVEISGTRILLFPWRPQKNVQEKLTWMTQIIDSLQATVEQRICLTKIPKQFFSFEFVIDDEQAQSKLDALLAVSLQRYFALPVWSEGTDFAGMTITAGDTALTIDTSYADYRDGGIAVIWQSNTACEIVPILSVAAGALTLASSVVGNYSGPVTIAPALAAFCFGTASKLDNYLGSSVFTITFRIVNTVAVTGYVPDAELDGLPIILNSYSDDSGEIRESISPQITITDFETGAFEIYDDKTYIKGSRSLRFYNDTPQECWHFRQLLHNRYGRQKPALIPTYKNDMNLNSSIGILDVSFRVDQIGLVDAYGDAGLRKYIAFFFHDGSTPLYRIVTGIVAGAGYDTVSISEALGITIDPGDCIISWLDCLRLTEDTVPLVWERAGRNTVDVALTKVQE